MNILLSAIAILSVVFLILLLKLISLKNENVNIANEVNKLRAEKSDVTQLEEEKRQIKEKNKKLFTMSETVYKEKKKVDEQIEQLKLEAEKLNAEKKKVEEKVKKLWNQSTAIHKEKERINELKLLIEAKHTEIIDSVNYAKRIQEAILPDLKEIFSHLPDSFILFKPRDIVSGDFYWFSNKNGKSIIAAVDCTGHGVPGAFMSMIGNTLLNQIVDEKGITDPSQILNMLNEEVNTSLKQTQEHSESRDGMDIAICCFDLQKMEVKYAGANRPLYIVKTVESEELRVESSENSQLSTLNSQLIEIKPDKCAIGGLDYDVPKVFTTYSISLKKNDIIYISTDGYADQFSPNDKKLMTKKFKETLLSIYQLPMEEQMDFLDSFIENWKGSMEQTDDILVIGVKV